MIVTVDVATPSAATGEVPIMVELAATADPAVNTTVPPTFTTGVAMERILLSALIDLRVQVEIPDASEAEQADIAFVVPVSVAENVGIIPLTKLLEASLFFSS